MKYDTLFSMLRAGKLLGMLVLAIGLAACGGGAEESGASSTEAGAAQAEDAIVIQPVGNEMKFAETSFTVEAGQEVTLVFENTATSPAMQHNVVVLTSDDDAVANRVGQAAIEAGEASEYVPEDDAVLAFTPLAQPGETVRVTFTAPAQPGTYRYICTFPGHYMMMQGTMIVV